MPKVSVIIPFYNQVQWVANAVQTVMAQTYRNFEIILVDDGSSEDINSCIDIYNEQLRYVYQENKGPAAARNLGISIADGAFIAFLDSDDLFLPDKIEKQVAYMLNAPEALMSHTSYQLVDINGNLIDVVNSGQFAGYVYPAILLGCPIATPTVMIRREAFCNGLRFNENIRIAEDILLWSEIAQRSPILGIDQPLTRVRKHGKNAADDLEAQVLGSLNSIEYGILKNFYLGFRLRRKLLGSKYLGLSHLYLQKGDEGNCLHYAFLALYNNPLQFVHGIYVTTVRRIYRWAYHRKRIYKALRLVFHILRWHWRLWQLFLISKKNS
jgi:glycosyltransferase involved in cell wall biosynthesis